MATLDGYRGSIVLLQAILQGTPQQNLHPGVRRRMTKSVTQDHGRRKTGGSALFSQRWHFNELTHLDHTYKCVATFDSQSIQVMTFAYYVVLYAELLAELQSSIDLEIQSLLKDDDSNQSPACEAPTTNTSSRRLLALQITAP